MTPALISALISALTVMGGAVTWRSKLRAAIFDLKAEIRGYGGQLDGDPESLTPEMFVLNAEESSRKLLRQWSSRSTNDAVDDAYYCIGQIRPQLEGSAIVRPDTIAAAKPACDLALRRLDYELAWNKLRSIPAAEGVATPAEQTRSRVRMIPRAVWVPIALLFIVPPPVFLAVNGLTSEDQPDQGAVKTLNPEIIDNAQGTVTLCTGADVTGARNKARNDFNRRFADDGLRANFMEFGEQADQQYESFSALQRAESDDCDVFYSDVVWTADFASQGWLHDLSNYVENRRREFVPAMLDTVSFEDRTWGVPAQVDAGLLYYRKSTVDKPPATWQELYKLAMPDKRLRYQARAYEGLTVNFLEIAYATGAEDIIVGGDTANLDQQPALDALRFMVEGLSSGVAPRDVVDQKEEESRRAFERERADLMRHWPYVYGALAMSPVAGDFGVSPLPRWEGEEERASVLGGQNLVISSSTKNAPGALKLVDYLSSEAVIKQGAVDDALAPVLLALWKDPVVQRALPVFEDLRDAINTARARPVVANYQEVSRAIYTNVNRALQREVSAEAALEAANTQIQQVLDR